MDQSVLDALQRWPDVPAAYGWLSLSARGEWRLHPLGDAQQGGPGVGISNPQILGFMGRNYASEPDGAWFFQNGPQRVYVRLDAAPYILHLRPESGQMVSHNGREVQEVKEWFTDECGQLYAQTNIGGIRLDDRDLIALSEMLTTTDGTSFLDVLERADQTSLAARSVFDATGQFLALANPVALTRILHKDIPARLGFISQPSAATIS
jgi:hypothetical protein